MHLSKTTWIAISGVVWFIVGVGLLTLGLNFIVFKAQMEAHETTSLIAKMAPVAGGREQAALALITIGLIIGFIKGRFVLVKTVRRVVERILKLELPIKFSEVYSKGYLILIGGMILLGMSMKWLGLPAEVRGLIDVAIGSALMNGATAYFRVALAVNKEMKKS
ncbi:MAG: hypothetical protein JSS60_03065 [Verrucomicrobia bacterium]|nr:hypothetical protein [Verrucomicrobiota bacterium]